MDLAGLCDCWNVCCSDVYSVVRRLYSLTCRECVATVCCGDGIDVAFMVCIRLRRQMWRGEGCKFGDVIWHCIGLCGDWNESELFVVWIWQICAIVALFAVVMFIRSFKGCIR